MLAICFFGLSAFTGIWAFNLSEGFDRAFFMLGGLSLGSFGLGLSCSTEFFPKPDDGSQYDESILADRVGWIGFFLMVIGIGMSIYSGCMENG